MTLPRLTFFCELEPDPLQTLISESTITCLVDLKAHLSLGILDLSDPRAEVVKRLNSAGVPVTAWLLLPEEQGYWFNLDNVAQATAQMAR